MINCSIAIQILPLETDKRLDVIDEVINFILKKHKNVVVTPFETVIEGEYESLMATLKEAILIAGKNNKNIFTNIKINYGSVMTIDEKISKFN